MPENRARQVDRDVIEHLPFATAEVVGARARIGCVVLATDYTLEHEFRFLLNLPGVDFYVARIANSPTVTPQSLAAMGPLITKTAKIILPGDRLDVLAYGCTSASMVLATEEIGRWLRAAKPEAATTNPASAAFAALRALEARRVAVLTPYRRDVNMIVQSAIEAAGFRVPVFGSFNEESDPTVAAIDSDSLRAAVRTIVSGRDVDAVFVSCTSLRMAKAIPDIEAELGLPVTSSNHAMAWHALRLAGVTERRDGVGRLFQCGLRVG